MVDDSRLFRTATGYAVLVGQITREDRGMGAYALCQLIAFGLGRNRAGSPDVPDVHRSTALQ